MNDKLAILAMIGACGGGSGGSHFVNVEIHKSFPFVDGDTADDANFVAVQDGDGPFVQATGANGVFRVHVDSDRYGVAVGCDDTAGSSFVDIEIVQQTFDDGDTYKTFCKSQPATGMLTVQVGNLPTGQTLVLRTPLAIAVAATDGPQTITVPTGPTELFGVLSDGNRQVTRLFRLSADVSPTATVAIDAAADGAPPDRVGTFVVDPDDPSDVVRTSWLRPNAAISLSDGFDGSATHNYVMPPAALRQADDLFRISISGPTGVSSITAKSPGALVFTMPALFTAPDPELVEAPFVHPVWTFEPTPSVLPKQSYFLEAGNFSDANATLFRDWFVTISESWIAGAPTVRYEFPDLSGMPGFAALALLDTERLDTTIARDETTDDTNTDGAHSTSSAVGGVLGKFCGDGVVTPPEACDPGEAGETATCDFDCTAAMCGDGTLNTTAGEECDPPDGTTCSAACKLL
jgi:hypothetical protein